MSPSAESAISPRVVKPDVRKVSQSALLYGNLRKAPPKMSRQEGNWVYLDDDSIKYFDGSGGPALTSVGYGNSKVIDAIKNQLDKVAVPNEISFRSDVSEALAQHLIDSTGGLMKRVYICSSGSEASEAMMKLGRQYHLERDEPQRIRFISRNQSYHGATMGALSLSGFPSRKKNYGPLLPQNVSFVSPCNPYRDRKEHERDESYVDRLALELDEEFKRVGGDTVIAFVAETVVGAALGAAPAVPGYFKAMQEVCHKHGALFISDEVMCGAGRSGGSGLHAWQQEEGFVPDIFTMGKGLTGGYAPVGAVLASRHVAEVIEKGSGEFAHGQTFQGHPLTCRAALEVLTIIREEKLLQNVDKMGQRLALGLRQGLDVHPNVGSIQGKGLMWGIHFVKDKATKEPFDPKFHVACQIHKKALTADYELYVYKGEASADAVKGDHIILAPALNVTEQDIDHIVRTTVRVINDFFLEFDETELPPL